MKQEEESESSDESEDVTVPKDEEKELRQDDDSKLKETVAHTKKTYYRVMFSIYFGFCFLLAFNYHMIVFSYSSSLELLVLSLKGADDQLREKIFSCMSTRAAANIQDEMGAMGPVRLTEVQEAQKQIINVARRLSDEGTIVLAGRGGDDFV